MLKLYRGEDVIRQDPEDIDPDRWLGKGELTELPKAPLGEAERRHIVPSVDQRNSEIPLEPALEIQIIPEDPEEMLKAPPEWNEVPDLMMEAKNVLPEAAESTKRKQDEVTLGRRKRRKEDDIPSEKGGHLPTVSWKIQNPEGFYFEDWNEVQQEEDEWQAPDK